MKRRDMFKMLGCKAVAATGLGVALAQEAKASDASLRERRLNEPLRERRRNRPQLLYRPTLERKQTIIGMIEASTEFQVLSGKPDMRKIAPVGQKTPWKENRGWQIWTIRIYKKSRGW